MDEKCGVVGVRTDEDAAFSVYRALYALQHRGQEGAGITTYDGFRQHSKKGPGLVSDIFERSDLESLRGGAGIGHVRYDTSDSTDAYHPFTVTSKQGSLALAHNGQLVNSEKIRENLEELGHAFTTSSDSEVIVHELARNLIDSSLSESIEKTLDRIRGAYSLVLMYNETVIAIRDPLGIRPLCIGRLDNGHIVASESVAIDTLGGEKVRDIKPGEMIILDEDGFSSYTLSQDRHAHCFFEYVYFARPDSEIDDRLVYDVRQKLGRLLYEKYGVDTDVVSPVPDSGRSFAAGYAEASGIDYAEALMKNRYVGRTFIMPDGREEAVRMKLNTIKSRVDGKSVTLIDDSVVRGNTSKQLVKLLRESGAKEVHLRIGSPPIRAPCYLGIDMKTRDELIASDRSLEDIEQHVGADSLEYLSLDEISEALSMSLDNLCTGCVSEKYPIDIEGEEMREEVSEITEA